MIKFIPFSKGVRPFSSAAIFGDWIFVSGQVGIDRETGKYPSGVTAQTDLALQNLREILTLQNYSFNDVIKITVYLVNQEDIQSFNAAYSQVFFETKPARSLVVVKSLAGEAIVEIDAIAVKSHE